MSSLTIQTNGLSKTLRSVQVIQPCDMHVTKHVIYGFLGENGAGKTTLFKMLAGILTPTSGIATVLGYDVATQASEMLKQIGTLIEAPMFYEHLSAAESLKLHLAYMGMEGLTPQTTLIMVGLPGTGKWAVSKFSLGMRQRLVITRVFSHWPKLSILDKPINGLDPADIREMRELLFSLVIQHQMMILLSSYILLEIEQVTDTIGFISKGRLFEETSLTGLRERHSAGLEYYFMKKREER